MNTGLGKSLSVGHFCATLVAALFLAPMAGQAQSNTATGYAALTSNITGSWNTADGSYALYANTTGWYNTANGSSALFSNTSGNYNTADGGYALYSNTSGSYNTANGYQALYANTTGFNNTATGYQALYANTTGNFNTANGYLALTSNTTGVDNTATGYLALELNTTGNYNTANGYAALIFNTTGNYNTANGSNALWSNSTGTNNTVHGAYALFANTTGSYNIALGYGSGQGITTGSNNIVIGNSGTSADNGVIRIGTFGTQKATYLAGISGVQSNGGVAVYVNASGQLGTLTSSRRFKYDIKDMNATSDKLMDLRPVMFRYKAASEDGTHPIQYGLIAEEVAKIYPDLVQYDKEGKPFTVYYHLLTPLMLNELQKAHHQNEAQKTEIDALKAEQQKQGSELASLRQMLEQKQSSEAAAPRQAQQSHPLVFTAFVMVACVGAAFALASRTRQAR